MRLTTNTKVIRGSADVAPVFREILNAEDPIDQDKEHFWCCCLNTKNRILRIELITLGLLDQTIVHPREVFRAAIGCAAKCIILAHNHPSGDPTPSDMDITLTQRLINCGLLLGIQVLDHVIVTGTNAFWSMQEHTSYGEPGENLNWAGQQVP